MMHKDVIRQNHLLYRTTDKITVMTILVTVCIAITCFQANIVKLQNIGFTACQPSDIIPCFVKLCPFVVVAQCIVMMLDPR